MKSRFCALMVNCALVAVLMQLCCLGLTPSIAGAQTAVPPDATTLDGSPITVKYLKHSFTITPYKGMKFFFEAHGRGRKYFFVDNTNTSIGHANFQVSMFVNPAFDKPEMAYILVQQIVGLAGKRLSKPFERALQMVLADKSVAKGIEYGGVIQGYSMVNFCVGAFKPGAICIIEGSDLAATYPTSYKKMAVMGATCKMD